MILLDKILSKAEKIQTDLTIESDSYKLLTLEAKLALCNNMLLKITSLMREEVDFE